MEDGHRSQHLDLVGPSSATRGEREEEEKESGEEILPNDLDRFLLSASSANVAVEVVVEVAVGVLKGSPTVDQEVAVEQAKRGIVAEPLLAEHPCSGDGLRAKVAGRELVGKNVGGEAYSPRRSLSRPTS